jgi:hypothetical protein
LGSKVTGLNYFLNLGWDSQAVYASDISAEVGPQTRFIFNKYVDELNSLGPEFVILRGPVYDTNNTLRVPPDKVLSISELYNMNWNINTTVNFIQIHMIQNYVQSLFFAL